MKSNDEEGNGALKENGIADLSNIKKKYLKTSSNYLIIKKTQYIINSVKNDHKKEKVELLYQDL